MDTSNRPHSNLPARLVPDGSRLPAPYPVSPSFGIAPAGVAAAAAPPVSPRMLLRGLIRHWWRILGLSILVSLPLVYAIYYVIEPKYEAVGVLQVQPLQPSLYSASTGNGDRDYADNYLQTQLNLINSREVLTKVATSPQVSNLPLIKNSEDYFVDLGDALSVSAIKDTFLIRVALESYDRNEAFVIVQAVIQAYMEKIGKYGQAINIAQKKRLQQEAAKVDAEITKTTSELIKFAKKGNIQLIDRVAQSADGAEGKGTTQEIDGDHVSEDEYSKFRYDYIRTKLELDAEEKILKQKQAEADSAKTAKPEDQNLEQTLALAELNQQIEAEFRADPAVVQVVQDIEGRKREIDRIAKIARRGGDPALTLLRQDRISLEKRFKDLWEEKYEGIRQRVLDQNPDMGSETEKPGSTRTLKDVEQTVAELKARKDTLESHLQDLQIENKEARVDAINAEIARKQLDDLRGQKIRIDNHLKQAMYESETEQIRVSIADAVQMPVSPTQNKRLKLMAIAPVAVLAGFIGLFLLFEIKAERVSDPDSLSTRVQSEVFALPPLPSAREVRKMRALEHGGDQIDRFIQRLDHLRFAVCGSQSSLEVGRCVLITSAVGGEGKTTLAAQLAARCGNAGMSTLLIDADMRRASLGTLLDVADGPGLSDVLKEELTVEEATVPVQGGTFHLLPAGTPIDNISLALHGPNFGILIARLRELYDLIVIDSPPVLPVPDALILGQWADGVILASRFDVSRFPQVERARRQLDNAGITVLGTVINGMRASDSYYGHYSYTRKKGPEPDSSNAS